MIAKYAISETNGFSFQNKVLRVNRHGKTEAEVPFEGDFDQAYSRLELVELFPKMVFSLSGDFEAVQVTVTVQPVFDEVITGKIKVNGLNGVWEAKRRQNSAFLHDVPARHWVKDNEGMGWEIYLPQVYLDLDGVIVKRLGAMIEELIYRLAQADVNQPVISKEIKNTFSLEDPLWPEPVPVIRKHGTK